jgi:large subunit ribosomal protein L21e
VRNRIEKKRINVRIEHVRPSKCRLDFLARVKKNEDLKRAAKVNKTPVALDQIKRFPGQPKAGYVVTPAEAVELVAPQPFSDLM